MSSSCNQLSGDFNVVVLRELAFIREEMCKLRRDLDFVLKNKDCILSTQVKGALEPEKNSLLNVSKIEHSKEKLTPSSSFTPERLTRAKRTKSISPEPSNESKRIKSCNSLSKPQIKTKTLKSASSTVQDQPDSNKETNALPKTKDDLLFGNTSSFANQVAETKDHNNRNCYQNPAFQFCSSPTPKLNFSFKLDKDRIEDTANEEYCSPLVKQDNDQNFLESLFTSNGSKTEFSVELMEKEAAKNKTTPVRQRKKSKASRKIN